MSAAPLSRRQSENTRGFADDAPRAIFAQDSDITCALPVAADALSFFRFSAFAMTRPPRRYRQVHVDDFPYRRLMICCWPVHSRAADVSTWLFIRYATPLICKKILFFMPPADDFAADFPPMPLSCRRRHIAWRRAAADGAGLAPAAAR